MLGRLDWKEMGIKRRNKEKKTHERREEGKEE